MQIFAHARDSILQLHTRQPVNAQKRYGDLLLCVSSFRFSYIYKCLQTAVCTELCQGSEDSCAEGADTSRALQQMGAHAQN